MFEKILNTAEAALFLGMSKAFLERDRCESARVPFIRVGARAIRYRLSDLENYLAKNIRLSTSDKGDNNE